MRIIQFARRPMWRGLILGFVLQVGTGHVANGAQPETDLSGDVAIPPLIDAALRGDLRSVRILLRRKGTQIDVRFDGETPLMKALAPYIGLPPSTMGPPSAAATRAWLTRIKNKMTIAKVLIEAGADVTLATPDGATALHFAALAYGPEDLLLPIVRDLIKHGAAVDAKTTEGRTPLQFAAWRKRLAVAKILVSAGASLDARNVHGKTAADELVAQDGQHALDELREIASKRH